MDAEEILLRCGSKKKKKEKKKKKKTKFFARDHTNFGEAYGRKEELKLK